MSYSESKPWPWPDSLDAVIAAPNHHRVLFENERVRVLEVRIGPGEFVPVHTHRWPGRNLRYAGERFSPARRRRQPALR